MLLRLFLHRLDRRIDERLVPRTDRHGGTRHLVEKFIVGIVELHTLFLLLDHEPPHRLAEVLLMVHGLLELQAPHQQSAAY